MMASLKWYLAPSSPSQLKKNLVKVGSTLTKLSGSAHEMDLNSFRDIKLLMNWRGWVIHPGDPRLVSLNAL